jgi:hypothetical protein
VKDAVAVAKNVDGTETSEEWKAKAKKTLGEILSHNENTRNPLAHWHLEPQEDGSIKLAPRKQPADQKTWNLKHKIEEVLRLTEQLRTITHDLTTLKIRIPDLPDYWLRADAYQPRQHLEVAFGQGARALQMTEAEGKEVQK